MLSLQSTSRGADLYFAKVVKPRARSFGTEVPPDDAETGYVLLTEKL
jgi:hypothetical protein